jgi:hypothetical protein
MVDERTDHHETDNPSVHHEESDINVRLVLIGAAIALVLAILMHVGLWGMYVGFRALSRSLDPISPSRVAEPRVDPNVPPEFIIHWSEPARYLENIRNEEAVFMDSYGWVEPDEGIVRVPIGVAMELALTRGYPTRREPGDPVIGSGEGEIRPPTLRREVLPRVQDEVRPEDPAPADLPQDRPGPASEPDDENGPEGRIEPEGRMEGSDQ